MERDRNVHVTPEWLEVLRCDEVFVEFAIGFGFGFGFGLWVLSRARSKLFMVFATGTCPAN